ncbi:ABC transporter substrate-binding protein, partial [Chloroflexota bacterium]
PTTPSETPVQEPIVSPDVPQYGGMLTLAISRDTTCFDNVITMTTIAGETFRETNEDLWAGDWAKGNAGGYGTGETSWEGNTDVWAHKGGRIAESWELPTEIVGEEGTVTYHIRQGMHWALNPNNPRPAEVLVGGREVTVDDVIFSLNQVITVPTAKTYKQNAELRVAKITSPAPWTVTITLPWEAMQLGIMRFGEFVKTVPHEVVEEYGNMAKWEHSVGSGAFILKDLVPGSQVNLVRNPNYWGTDPVGPGMGNQLPYLDGIRFLVIPDASTQQAAFRTGKIDRLGSLTKEDFDLFNQALPELQFSRGLYVNSIGLGMRTDIEPFSDIRVRRALMMATDWESIRTDYYGGDCQYLTWPISYMQAYRDAYLGPHPETDVWPDDAPESIKELYVYNPEKAKQLLSEAGYPDGFKTWANMQNTQAVVDYYSIIKGMWSKVGVDLELRPLETGALTTLSWDHTYEQMIYQIGSGGPIATSLFQMGNLRGVGQNNTSLIDDPQVEELFPVIQELALTNQPEVNRLYRELMKYVLDQAWVIPMAKPFSYTMWWPWLRNFSGENGVAYFNTAWKYLWIDQDLKESMGY